MSTYYIIYHGFILLALVLSILSYIKGYKKAKFFIVLLFITIAVELLAEILIARKIKFVWAYHGFVVIEYCLFCMFYLSTVSAKRNRLPIIISIPMFTIFSFCISYFLYRFQSFPGININAEGILLFLIFTYLLFNLNVESDLAIYYVPEFWISLGVLTFFGGTFLFNGVYTKLLHLDSQKALTLFAIINKPLNLFLYGCIITGLLCSIRKRKYITQ